jgi:hypothetical protein
MYFQDLKSKIMSGKKLQMIQIHPFQEKEMEGGEGSSQFSQLKGQWKVPFLGVPLGGSIV